MHAPAAVRLAVLTAITAGALAPWSAAAQSRSSVDVSLGARGSTNPFLTGSEKAVGSATLSIDPQFTIENETSSFDVDGHFQLAQYSSRHGTDAAARLALRSQAQLNERTSLSTAVMGRSSRSAHDLLELNSGPQLDTPEPIVPDLTQPDITIVGSGARISNVSSQISLQRVLSPTSTLGLGVNGGVTRTSGPRGNDYAQIGLQANYARQLNERAFLNGSLHASQVDYKDRSLGDGRYITPLIGIQYTLNEDVTLSAQAGATVASVNDGLGGKVEQVDLAGNISLCRRTELSRMCANASRNSQPTAFGGLSTSTNLGISYVLQTGSSNQLSVNGRYARTSRILEQATGLSNDAEVFGIGGRYSHDLNSRLAVYGSTSLTRTNYINGPKSRDSVQVEIGIRHRFGDLR